MLSFLRTWVLNIVTIIVFVTFLEILLPSSNIKKYIKMIVGLLVMLVILSPILELVNGNIKIENEIIKASSLLEQKSLAINSDLLERHQNEQMIALYKLKIEHSIKERIEYESNAKVLHINATVDEDINSHTFGSLMQLDMVLSEYNETSKKFSSNTIPPIKIKIDNSQEKYSSVAASDINSILTERLKENIADLYGLQKQNIYIEIE